MQSVSIVNNASDTIFLTIETCNDDGSKTRRVNAIVSEAAFTTLISLDGGNINEHVTGSDASCHCLRHKAIRIGKCLRVKLGAIFFSALLYELHRSLAFRACLIDNVMRYDKVRGYGLTFDCQVTSASFRRRHVQVKVVIEWHVLCWLDMSWNNKLDRLFVENVELENTMAWLSTLGGAYSSLGDEFLDYAKIAGRISQHQYRLAAKLGDAVVLSKCKLYLALSFLQLGHLRRAKHIIKEQYNVACSLPTSRRDVRLENMCMGAWAKLKYAYVQRKTARKHLNNYYNNNNNTETIK